MKTLMDKNGKRKLVFLSQNDKDFLIYMCTDAWITPDVKRFKSELLDRVQEENLKSDSDH